MRGLDLFSGIGGISLALSEWVRPVAYCENDRYAQGVLLSRMASGELPIAPIWDDVRTLRAKHLPQGIDIIYGGFPCQDISIAGNRVGLAGERSGLIREVWRLVDEIRPRFVFLENVPNIIGNGLDRILAALAHRGIDARWVCLSAADVGACHIRERWWLIAHTDESRLEGRNGTSVRECAGEWIAGASGASAANTECTRLQELEGWRPPEQTAADTPSRAIGWPTVAAVCGADDGVSHRVDRIKCLGNSVVPQCAKEAFKRLIWRMAQ